MRKILLGILVLTGLNFAFAESSQPRVVDTFRCDGMSANGQWMVGRSNTFDLGGGAKAVETSICNVLTGEIFGTSELFTLTPFSRPISNSGVAILSTYDESTDWFECLYLVAPGKAPVLMEQFYKTGPYKGKECYAVAITPDASKFLAYYEEYPTQYPFVCTLNPDYSTGEPQYLPLPEKDFSGQKPFRVELTRISDDASTIVGMVTSGNGRYNYPIVYKRGNDGTWSWNCPLESLYETGNGPNFYSPTVALSRDGSKMAFTQEVESNISGFPDYVVWTLDTNTGAYNVINSKNPDIIATQILNDGTIIGTFFATIKISYILTPGADDFVDFVEFATETKPEYGEWMKQNLMVVVQDVDSSGNIVTLEMPNTGEIFVSEDLSVFSAGIQTSEFDEDYNLKLWSYAFTDFMSAAIESPVADMEKSVVNVYNLHGVKVLTTDNPNDVNNLEKGIYVVNGKKVMVK